MNRNAGQLLGILVVAIFVAGCSGTTPLPNKSADNGDRPRPVPVSPRPPPVSPAAPAAAAPAPAVPVAVPAPAAAPAPVPAPVPLPPAVGNTTSPSTGSAYLDLTPLSTYEDQWDERQGEGRDFSGAYTRLVIRSEISANAMTSATGVAVQTEGREALGYKPRPWPARALMGKEFSANFSAAVKVGAFDQVVPLLTIGHQSNSSGERWTRQIYHDALNFPLFLVKRDGSASVPQIYFQVKLDKTYASRGAAAALGIAVQVAKALTNPPQVMTRLTSESAKNEARALDSAISQLFSSSITEEHWTDRDLRLWRPAKTGASGVIVQFNLPGNEDDYEKPVRVGRWRITFEEPRPSIFSDWRVCSDGSRMRCEPTIERAKNAVVAEVTSGEILNYKLAPTSPDTSSIESYLGSRPWFTTSLIALSRSKGDDLRSALNSFCNNVVNEITRLELSAFDAQAVLWAIHNGSPDSIPSLKQAEGCTKALGDFAKRA